MRCSMIIRLRAFAATIVLIGILGSSETVKAEPDVWITVRVLPGARMETLKYLATVGKPTKIQIKAGDDLKKILHDKYGWYNGKMWALFKARNPNVESTSAQESREISLPVMPIWFFNYQSQIHPDKSISEHALLQVGIAGPKTVNDIAVANDKTKEDLDTVMPDEDIILPYVTRVVSFRLEKEFAPNPQMVIAKLRT